MKKPEEKELESYCIEIIKLIDTDVHFYEFLGISDMHEVYEWYKTKLLAKKSRGNTSKHITI